MWKRVLIVAATLHLAGCGATPVVAPYAVAPVRTADLSPAKAEAAAVFLISRYQTYGTPDNEKAALLTAIGRNGTLKAVRFLVGLYYNANEATKIAIIRALGTSRSDAAVDFLLDEWRNASNSSAIKQAMIEAIGLLGVPDPTTSDGVARVGGRKRQRITIGG